MIDSLKERIKHLPKISIEADSEFVVELKKGNSVIAEIVCSVQELQFDMSKNESKVKLSVYNPHFKGRQTITEYY